MSEHGDRAPDAAPLSEEGMIARFFVPLASNFPGAYGLRDDAAVIEPPPGHDLVVTTDALVAGVHFFADDHPADIAWKALAVNVSDLAAKGAAPLAYSLALALPAPPSEAFLSGFAAGLAEAQAAFGIALSGGDTTSTRGETMISVTAFGTVPRGKALRRGEARSGDTLYVSGTIGDGALGLKLRRGDADAAGWPVGGDAREWLISRYLRPQPRIALAPALIAHAAAAMDISDGLMIDCRRLCVASGLAGTIHAPAIPFAPHALPIVQSPDMLRLAMTGGDDYEILAAIRSGEEAAFEAAAAHAGVRVSRVGRLSAGTPGVIVIGADGPPLDTGRGGFEHFT
jgi:thiamine-monophosphate kinase